MATTAIGIADQEVQRRSLTTPIPAAEYIEAMSVPIERVERYAARSTTQVGQQPSLSPSVATIRNRTGSVDPRRVSGLDKWEGKILAVEGDIFTAELYPIDREGMPITAEFDVDLLGADAADAVPGDTFYLSIRTVKSPGSRPVRTESIRLRRLGRISQEELKSAYAEAEALMERLEQLSD
ncbi:hypothetical protein [Streptomyces sp. bgisy060]|uniref:hypothetical protein n=1 Tax=Streptomyces sp. bgisy060 TaxID=3413775 RepID=UPI003EB9B7E9